MKDVIVIWSYSFAEFHNSVPKDISQSNISLVPLGKAKLPVDYNCVCYGTLGQPCLYQEVYSLSSGVMASFISSLLLESRAGSFVAVVTCDDF